MLKVPVVVTHMNVMRLTHMLLPTILYNTEGGTRILDVTWWASYTAHIFTGEVSTHLPVITNYVCTLRAQNSRKVEHQYHLPANNLDRAQAMADIYI